MILVNTDKGQHLLDMVKDRVVIYERPVQEAIAGNSTLCKATEKEEDHDFFWSMIKEKGFHKAVKPVYGINVN